METIKKILAVIFARVSSKEQEETGYSLPAQEKFLQEYAGRSDVNLEVDKVFQISESASGKIDRKTFKEMLDYVRKNNVPVIVVETTDRLTRNFADVPALDAWLMEDSGHQIHLVKEGCVLHRESKSHEWFMWRVKVATAEYYVKLLSENVKKGQKEKTSQGWLATKPPLGYKTIGEKGHKIHVIDEKVAPYIKEMFTLYATGNYSTVSLGKKMYEAGFRSRAGGRVVKSKVHKLLCDPFYYGNFMWKGKEHEGKHEPIIDRDLYDQVKAKLTRPSAPYHNKHSKELRGKVFCVMCKKTVTWERQKSHWYGACKQCKAQLGKESKYIRQEVLENELFEHLNVLAPENSEVLNILKEALKESHSEESAIYEAQINGINASLERIRQRMKTMYDDKLDGRITAEFYDEKVKAFDQERQVLMSNLHRVQSDNSEYYKIGYSIHLLASCARKVYESPRATLEERRMLLSYAFENITVSKGVITPEYTPAFGFLAHWMPKVNEAVKILEPMQKTAKTYSLSGDLQNLSYDFPIRVSEIQNHSRTSKNPSVKARQGQTVPLSHSLLGR